jgi:hypothetical protein
MSDVVLAIVGSVRLEGNAEAASLIEQLLDRYEPTKVVSGGAKGVDTMGVTAARARGIPVEEFVPTVARWWGPGGYKERNQQIADACTHLVRIIAHDTKTYGSGWTRDRAKEQGKHTAEFIIDRDPNVG